MDPSCSITIFKKIDPDQLLNFLLLFCICLAPFTFLWQFKKQKQQKTSKTLLPPGPAKLPIIGNLLQLGSLPHRSLQDLARTYGPLMFLQLGSIPALVVSSADMAREVFKNHDLVFSGRPQLYAATKLSYGCNDLAFSPYGEFWKGVRKIVMLELLSLKRVQSFKAARDEEVGHLLEFVRKSLSNPINLSELALQSSNNVVCRVAFGKKYIESKGEVDDGSAGRFNALLGETQELLGGFCLADFFPSMAWLNKFNGLENRLDKNFRELDDFYNDVIKEHLDSKRPEPEQEDLVDVLLRVQKDPNQAVALTDDQVKGVITDIFIAGTDTSAATLVWIMTELIRNPRMMKRAQDEVRGAVKGNRVQESDVEGLVYLKAVVKETLRLHPPVPLLVPRETTESCTIGGSYTIPAKTRVFFNAKSIATDPEYWKDPETFLPDRFLNSSVDYKGQNFEFLPFGAGRRGCPGINFSVQLVELELANLLHDFDWELPEGMRREDLDMNEAFGLTMHKKVPLLLVARPVTV